MEPPLPLRAPPPTRRPPAPSRRQPPAASAAVVIDPPAASEPSEDQQMLRCSRICSATARCRTTTSKRELTAATQALARQRTDVNRVRLAVLYTLLRTSPQDDQRAVQLFDNVAKNASPGSPVRQLAAVLQAQVTERQRAVRDEQQKADAAIQKLEALRAMERSLLRDRDPKWRRRRRRRGPAARAAEAASGTAVPTWFNPEGIT